ncbi:M23 family metallopeptidase [Zavarzinia compransoris]|uniref:M23 family metallopeptidase n=1 Tax=Zavarzinia marina TaxID=2911065 RepID=UPI001F34057F|nr:M23 family metallopeptidase [Zavarzinia marina]MCF4164743.1 M23 family metallopeptidase [Zavarzinia marina]
MMRGALLALFLLAAGAAEAATVDGEVRQGLLITGHAEPGETVRFGDRKLNIAPDGRFVLGLGRDAEGEMVLDVTSADGGHSQIRRPIAKGDWKIQRIDGLPPAKVNPNAQAMERIKAERRVIANARAVDSTRTDWQAGLVWPAKGPISGVYGSQRILNGQPRNPHLGLDVAVPTGTPIAAAMGGVVTLAEPDLYFTGGTVIIDHGYGVQTLYAHLSRVDVKVGQTVAAGDTIALSGATGRVTGPHLHFGLAWYGLQLDPAPYLPAS